MVAREGSSARLALKLDGVVSHFELYLDGEKIFQHPKGGVGTRSLCIIPTSRRLLFGAALLIGRGGAWY